MVEIYIYRHCGDSDPYNTVHPLQCPNLQRNGNCEQDDLECKYEVKEMPYGKA